MAGMGHSHKHRQIISEEKLCYHWIRHLKLNKKKTEIRKVLFPYVICYVLFLLSFSLSDSQFRFNLGPTDAVNVSRFSLKKFSL